MRQRVWATIYIDASVREGKTSWAVWIRSVYGRIVEGGPSPSTIRNSNHAEMFAAYKDVTLVQERWPDITAVQINTDSLHVKNALDPKTFDDRKIPREFLQCIKASKIYICTKHVKGHTGGKGIREGLNHRVDLIAGTVTGKYPGRSI